MVDLYGKWYEEADYSHYPKEKWCFMDYMADWIRKQNYTIKTDMENLINMVEEHYRVFDEDRSISRFRYIAKWAEEVQLFIEQSGGLQEFDYYC